MTETDNLIIFEQFIDHYSTSISLTIARLTGLTDKKELETVSVNVLIDLWKNRDRLFNEIPPTAFIYKTLLHHVFTWLKQQGKEDHILLLQNTLPIDPAHYIDALTPEKKTSNISRLVRKMKEMLK
jgi:hypothetical protein